MLKSIGVGPELFKNRKRIRNKSFRTYITRFSVIDLHGRRIHELFVDVQVYYEIFSTGCCDIARRVHPYQVRPHCGHGGPLFRYSAQAGPTLWRGSP